jgi:hypothetical protein
MPGMLRPKGKPKRIAYKVLGVPENMKEVRKTEREKRIEQRLIFEETVRVR